ncbi:MAG: VCBS repeat-containing protein [Phycisphaeraceae bacterium]|nr:VCBS repeat-containing protein [Phycisphaeraceae bacterium]
MRDLSGNGLKDIATANSVSNNVNLWLDGPGGLPPAASITTPGSPSSLVAGELNGQPGLDLAVTGFSSNGVYVHSAPANSAIPQAPAFLNAGPQPFGIVAADFNADGRLDLAVSNFGTSTVSVLLANGTGGFLPRQAHSVGSANLSLATGDFNGDGLPDLAVANFHAGTVSVLLNLGNGTFSPHATYSAGNAPRGITTADFNGDGRDDLAVASTADGTVSTLINAGDGTFLARQVWPVGASPQAVTVGDVNNDGILDLVVPNFDGGTVSVLVGTGGGIFRPQIQFAVGAQPTAVAIGDIDRDGRPDLVVSTYSGYLSILLNATPTAAFTSHPASIARVRGQMAVYEVTAGPPPGQPLHVRWFKDGIAMNDGPRINGSASTRLQVLVDGQVDAGTYEARLSSLCGTVRSLPAYLVVDDCPADYNADGAVDLADLLDFLGFWQVGCP